MDDEKEYEREYKEVEKRIEGGVYDEKEYEREFKEVEKRIEGGVFSVTVACVIL